ncbi:MAG: hypothetical protein E7562_04770 [Ruminococcaceae bacterium]|nr:hypothetical protein [Oscillospiraceae bacterium]
MKKIFAILTVLALTFSLTACGNRVVETSSDVNPPKTEISQNTEDPKQELNSSNEIEEEVSENEEKNEGENTPQTNNGQNDTPVNNPEPSIPQTTPVETEPQNPQGSQEIDTNNKFFNPNNSNYDANAVSIKPRYVYWENGELVAECFVINGFSHNVFNINVKSITFSNSSGVIASGSGFGVLNNVTLAPYTNIVWTFRFAPDTVANYGANLSSLICNASVSNSY